MGPYVIRKILVALIILLPAISYSGCKKQEKCGCDGDILFSYTKRTFDRSSINYTEDGKSAYFTITNAYGYDRYFFCNPSEMYTKFQDLASENQLKISGDVYWDCSYLVNSGSGSSYYYNYYKVYQINVTELLSYMYGK